jgi:EthD domain
LTGGMEKLVYVFWRRSGQEPQQLRRTLLSEVRAGLDSLGVARLQVNIADLAEREAGLRRMGRTEPLPDGLVSFWLTSAYRRGPAEKVLAEVFERMAGYSVVESTILTNRAHPPGPAERTWGYSQVALLHVPAHMSFEEWRRVWLTQHTPVAIETQSNFRYVQNVVLQSLTDGAPPWRGIVEEAFPLEAMQDPHLFFDAVGDDAKLQGNLARMMESVHRFLEPDGTDLIRTSEYVLHAAAEPSL